MNSSAKADVKATVVTGVRYRASAGAKRDTVVVPRCSQCAMPHRHVAFETGDVFERAPHCKPWTRYLVVVTKTVPAAMPLSTGRAAA